MSVAASRPAPDRWCDVDGTPIVLFSQVEQVAESAEDTALFSRLHQHGQVVGRSRESLLVCFANHQVLSVRPDLVRVLPDTPDDHSSWPCPGRGGRSNRLRHDDDQGEAR